MLPSSCLQLRPSITSVCFSSGQVSNHRSCVLFTDINLRFKYHSQMDTARLSISSGLVKASSYSACPSSLSSLLWLTTHIRSTCRLSNEKPSAIFRLRGNFVSQTTSSQTAFFNPTQPTTGASVTAVLGISIEPLSQIFEQVNALPSAMAKPSPGPSDGAALAEKIVKHLFNYISGFVSGSGSSLSPDSMVPMNLIARWYENFLSKIRAGGVGFLDRQE